MPNDAPDAMMNNFHSVKSRKGGRRVFAGGCVRTPDAPVNGKIKCSLNRYLRQSSSIRKLFKRSKSVSLEKIKTIKFQ